MRYWRIRLADGREIIRRFATGLEAWEYGDRLGDGPHAVKVYEAQRPGRGQPWLPEELEQLERLYPDGTADELEAALGRTITAIYGTARTRGISKSAAYLEAKRAAEADRLRESGKAHRYPKGHVPANKGKKMPPGWAPGRMAETQFKRGQEGHNTHPLYGTRTCDGYVYVKVAEQRDVCWLENWKILHVIEWEREHGEVPDGHAVCFINGDRQDIRLENLELLSRAQLMERNTIHRLPEELRRTINLRGALKRRIRRMERQAKR